MDEGEGIGLISPMSTVVDFTLTEKLNNEMFVDVNGDEFLISSNDDKVAKLERDWNDSIFEASPTALSEYIEQSFAPALYEQIEKITGIELK
jgi:hypothetical protein